MTGRRWAAAVLATLVLLTGEAVLFWFGWWADGMSPAFDAAFRWSPIVGLVLGVALLVAIARRSSRLARAVGVAELVRIVVVAAVMMLIGGGDGDSAGLTVLSLVTTTTYLSGTEAFLALGVVARGLTPARSAPR